MKELDLDDLAVLMAELKVEALEVSKELETTKMFASNNDPEREDTLREQQSRLNSAWFKYVIIKRMLFKER